MNEHGIDVPTGWSVVNFRQARTRLQYGTSARCTDKPHGVPVLRIPNISPGRIDASHLKYCDLPQDEAQQFLLEKGDVLFIRTNGVLERLGACAAYQGGPRRTLFASYLIRAQVKEGIDPRYVAYFYSSPLGASLIAARATPAADGKYNLNTGTIDSLPLLLPPSLQEQQSIVAALDQCREALQSQDRCVAVAAELKTTVMVALFTRGLRGESQKETEVGLVPESWSVPSIGDVALQAQYGLSMRGQANGRTPILRMNCQDQGHVRFCDLQFVDLDEATLAAFRLNPGDLLFNRTNSIEHVGRTAIVENAREAVFASYLIRLSLDQERVVPKFLNYHMNRSDVQADIKRLASRAVGQANINATKLRTVRFPLPPSLDEQQEIVTVLDTLERKIALHREKREVLEQLFRSLLYNLMTGEIRVDQLDLSALTASDANERDAA